MTSRTAISLSFVSALPCTALLLLCIAIIPAAAQQRGAVTGTITDVSGAVVPGATVDAVAGNRILASATTGADGRYLVSVPAGQTVTLRARLLGFAEETTTAVAGSTHNLTLRVAAFGDRLIVTASRAGDTRANTTASIATYSAADIAALGATSVADILRSVAGLSVEATGREGSLTSLFSRGGESDYNLVLVDGVRVNQTGGAFDVSRVSAAEIDRIEIVRGGQSALYGSDAMGAVVQIFTKRAGVMDAPRVVGALEGGSFRTWRGDATLLGGAGSRVDYSLGLARRQTVGAFADVLPEDDRFDQSVVNGGLGVVLGDRASVRTGVRFSDAHGRAVGPIDYGSRDTGTSYDTKDLSWHLSVAHRWAPTVTGDATVAFSQSRGASIDAIADPTRQLYAVLAGTPGARFPNSPRLVRFVDETTFGALRVGQAPLGAGEFLANTLPFGVGDFPFTSQSRFRRPAFKYQADWMWHNNQPLTGGYEFERESDPLNAGFDLTNHAYFAQQRFGYADRWMLSVGARVDDNSRYGTTVSPKLSVGGYLVPLGSGPVSSLKVFSNVGTGIKNPQFNELFDTTFADGNPGLTPERARTMDLGVDATFADERVRGGVTVFDNRYTDQVAFRSTGFGRDGRPDFLNIAGSKARGVELETVLQRPVRGVTAAATYTFDKTEVTATTSTGAAFQPGQPLLRRPRHSGTVRFGYTAGRASLNLDLRVVGQRHDSPFLGLTSVPTAQSPTARAVDITVNPGYTVAGMGIDVRLHAAVTLFVRADNLTDAQYEAALGYPGLPRSGMAGLRFGVGGR